MHRRWLINRTGQDFLKYLSKSASVSPVFAQILVNRGIKTPEDVRSFLSPSATSLCDPFTLLGVREAIDRIREALRRGERVLVHGDYDADGITSTSILVSVLKKAGIDTVWFVPRRLEHGYGFNAPGVQAARDAGASLIITVDCGITAFETARLAKSNGIDLIITDHHEPAASHVSAVMGEAVADSANSHHSSPITHHGCQVPEAAAVIDPKLPGNPSGLAMLSGAGVAFTLARALAQDGSFHLSDDDVMQLLDLAAIGTAADVVPLLGENRIIVKQGLSQINAPLRTGIAALKAAAGYQERELKSMGLSFSLVPRINAAGRMGDASDVVRMLLTTDRAEADAIAEWLCRTNEERQRVELSVYEEARQLFAKDDTAPVILLAGEAWHEGVLGIVASKLAEEYYRPAFICTRRDGVVRGSGRSIPAFDLHAGLAACSDLLLGFGGHRQAAGVRLREENVPQFLARISECLRVAVAPEALVPALEIDADLSLYSITPALIRELGMMDPLGYGNPEPVLGAKGLDVLGPRIVGNNHLKLRLRQKSAMIDTIGFDMGEMLETISSCGQVDAAFTPGMNDWNGSRYLQLVLKGFRPSA